MRTLSGLLLLFLVLVTMTTPAKADTIYDLTIDNCSGGCQPGSPGTSMGSITLHDNGGGSVTVTVQLVSPLELVNTGLHETIDFNLTGITSINLSGMSTHLINLDTGTNGGTQTAKTDNTDHFDGFGNFEYAIALDTAQGAGGAIPTPVSFTVSATGLTVDSFATDGIGANTFFGVDVYNSLNGNTGPIGGSTPRTTATEPSSLVLLGSGLLGFAVVRRRSIKMF